MRVKTLLWVTLFSIAMGYLESAVVVYLRHIYYPAGFTFPLKPIDNYIGITEIFREAATLIMLVGIGIVAGRSNIQRFGYFIFSFAVWDIFYYIFLKAILNWPESLLTWDILFLIPVIWVGPVLAPVICSLTMICFTLLIIYFDEKTGNACINPIQWILLLTGSFIIIISFVADYIQFMLAHFSQFDTAHYKFFELFNFTQIESLMKYSEQYVPQCFPWWLFLTGELIIIISVILFYINMKKIVSVHVTWSHPVSNEKN